MNRSIPIALSIIATLTAFPSEAGALTYRTRIPARNGWPQSTFPDPPVFDCFRYRTTTTGAPDGAVVFHQPTCAQTNAHWQVGIPYQTWQFDSPGYTQIWVSVEHVGFGYFPQLLLTAHDPDGFPLASVSLSNLTTGSYAMFINYLQPDGYATLSALMDSGDTIFGVGNDFEYK